MSVKIISVDSNCPASTVGIQNNDTLISINGNEIEDVIDFRFYETNAELQLEWLHNNKRFTANVRKGQYESLGLNFETYLMDEQHSCRNKCIFCFIDQLPKGMRKTLYFKDDDSRLSFLFGNYITLTNLSDHEVDRIVKMHISPVNISVHTTNPELRNKMMNNRFAGDSLRHLYKMAQAGTKINCQIVLCPGINDGKELEKTISDLLQLVPSVQSIALVPVGLTKYRENLFPLRPYNCEEAEKVIDSTEKWQVKFQQKCGRKICFASDEFYLIAKRDIPKADFYEGFDQLENGVGLLANLKDEFEAAKEQNPYKLNTQRHISTVCGTSAAPFIRKILDESSISCHNLFCSVFDIKNRFFGETITVTGLITGRDLIDQLKDKKLGDYLIIPDVMLKHGEELFLDDVTLNDVKKALNVPIITIKNDGWELWDAITKGGNNE